MKLETRFLRDELMLMSTNDAHILRLFAKSSNSLSSHLNESVQTRQFGEDLGREHANRNLKGYNMISYCYLC